MGNVVDTGCHSCVFPVFKRQRIAAIHGHCREGGSGRRGGEGYRQRESGAHVQVDGDGTR